MKTIAESTIFGIIAFMVFTGASFLGDRSRQKLANHNPAPEEHKHGGLVITVRPDASRQQLAQLAQFLERTSPWFTSEWAELRIDSAAQTNVSDLRGGDFDMGLPSNDTNIIILRTFQSTNVVTEHGLESKFTNYFDNVVVGFRVQNRSAFGDHEGIVELQTFSIRRK